ncbi:lytic transglycosylase domain-containing protein [Candidatus Orientia mediorientalis]|nr:lytic transglycosylase domain-containing protein [Candidatus Orientia mediorientalis]
MTYQHLKNKQWDDAVLSAKNSDNKILYNIALSQKFLHHNNDITLEEITDFLQANPNYPQEKSIARQAEKVINNFTDQNLIITWFNKNHPQTARGHYYHALAAQKNIVDLNIRKKIIHTAWKFCDTDYIVPFLDNFAHLLTKDDYYAKVAQFILANKLTSAKALLSKISNKTLNHQVLNFMIAAANNNANTADLFAKLPMDYRYKNEVLYSFLTYKLKNNDYTIELEQLFAQVMESKITDNFLFSPDLWWQLRSTAAKGLLTTSNYSAAYNIVKDATTNNLRDSIEACWLAGWIALRFLNNSTDAITNFIKMTQIVTQPIDISKAYYWLGRSYQAAANNQAAQNYYKEAAQYPHTFYGQLAMLETENKILPLFSDSQIDIKNVEFSDIECIIAAEMLLSHDLLALSKIYAIQAIKHAKNNIEIYAIIRRLINMKELIGIKEVSYIAMLTKFAACESLFSTHYSYPTPYHMIDSYIDKDILYSTIRQESVFDQWAIGASNDQGLMQIMPATAQEVATKFLKVPHITTKLIDDPSHNIKLGSYYWKRMLEINNGSYILATASYNAGPSRVRGRTGMKGWIEIYGDPCKYKDDKYKVIDWIEMIPFNKRNYIQRVLENIHVYRAVLSKQSNEIYYIDFLF